MIGHDLDPRPGESQAGEPRLLAEINVTPFIDVMLVMLIIFMVAAPLMMVGVPLKLPKTAAQTVANPQKPVVVSLDKDGHLFIGNDETQPDQLQARLADRLKEDADPVVYVRADKGLDYGKVMDLLGKLGAAGVSKLSLVAEGQDVPGAAASPAPSAASP